MYSRLGTKISQYFAWMWSKIRIFLKSLVLTSTFLYLTTCCRGDTDVLRTIDPSLAAYIIEFKAEMEQRGVLPSWAPLPMVITYGATPDGSNDIPANGVCYTPANVILIQQSLKTTSDEYERWSTVMHELTHCMALVRAHSDDPKHIMYEEHRPDTMENRTRKLDDLARFIKKHSPIYMLKMKLEAPVELNDF